MPNTSPWIIPTALPEPAPGVIPTKWPIEKAKEYLELLKQIKALEDSIGCPCPEERAKPDYIKMLQEMVDQEKANTPKPGCQCKECQCGK